MTTEHETHIEARLEEMQERSRKDRRRMRFIAGGLLAAMVALNVAPVAANHLNVKTSDINNGAVTTPKLANNAVKPPKIDNGAIREPKIFTNAVNRRTIRDGAVGRAQLGAQAVPARGYGNIAPAPPVPPGAPVPAPTIAARSKNMGTVITHGGPALGTWSGNYCFVGLPFEPHAAVVTPANSAHRASVTHGASGACPAGTQLTVRLTNSSNNAVNGAFQIVIF